MNYLQFTDFRNNSKEYFDKVERGNSFVIIRKGKPVATLKPFKDEVNEGWKREIKKVKLKKCKDSSEYIISERNEK
jgi:prevent-host-death family protein